MELFTWIGGQIGEGLQWLVQQGASGLLNLTGTFSRFMVDNCESAFILFGAIGVFFIMANAKEKGMKMINLSIVVYLVMQVLGATL